MSNKKKSEKKATEKKIVAVKAPSVRKPAKPLADRLLDKGERVLKGYKSLTAQLLTLEYNGFNVANVLKDVAASVDALRADLVTGSFAPTTTRGRRDRSFKVGDKVQVKEKYANNGQISLDVMTVVAVIGEGKTTSLKVSGDDESVMLFPRSYFERAK
jgi:hypothetical protein